MIIIRHFLRNMRFIGKYEEGEKIIRGFILRRKRYRFSNCARYFWVSGLGTSDDVQKKRKFKENPEGC